MNKLAYTNGSMTNAQQINAVIHKRTVVAVVKLFEHFLYYD